MIIPKLHDIIGFKTNPEFLGLILEILKDDTFKVFVIKNTISGYHMKPNSTRTMKFSLTANKDVIFITRD